MPARAEIYCIWDGVLIRKSMETLGSRHLVWTYGLGASFFFLPFVETVCNLSVSAVVKWNIKVLLYKKL